MYKKIIDQIKELYPGQDYIPLHEPRFWGNEKAYVTAAIDSTFVSSIGMYVNRFEEMIQEYTGSAYAVATVNGTAALHMSLILAGVKTNDLVITQSMSFIATCNAITYMGAEPLFVDVDLNTLGLSPNKLEIFLKQETVQKNGECFHIKSQRRIAACVPMHTFGHPAQIYGLLEVCNRYSITLIEDAAEAIGSKYQGKHTGTFGELGILSFNGNKTITCGGGGVIVTNNERLGKLAKHLTTQAKVPHRWEFKHDQIGYNYRMPNINAALACAQMEQLDNFVSNKRELARIYKTMFQASDIHFFCEPEGAYSNYWLNTLLLENREARDKFITATFDHGIMTRPVWTLLHKLPMFNNCLHADLVNSEFLEGRIVNIPSSVRSK